MQKLSHFYERALFFVGRQAFKRRQETCSATPSCRRLCRG